MIGRTLGRFQIVDKLGEGGMGVVYRAFDTRLNRTVALKVLPPASFADEHRKQRFVQEAIAASALNHAHIVTTYDIDAVEGVEFIAMEYVEGESLDRVINGKPLPIPLVLRYATQLAGALATAHRSGIVHRDIKPANVMVTADGDLKVLDFGLAKLVERAPGSSDAATIAAPHQTTVGTIVGTAAYMAPEQAEGKRITPACDVFAAGVVIYEMLTGRRAFRGDSEMAVLAAVMRDHPTPLASIRTDSPTTLNAIVSKCLAKNPAARYPTAAELLTDLNALQHASTVTTATTPSRVPMVLVAVLGALVAALGVTGWWSVRETRVRETTRAQLLEIERLIDQRRIVSAFQRLRQLQRTAPDDPEVKMLGQRLSYPVPSIASEPSGATIEIQDYGDPQGPWERLGETPLKTDLPVGALRLRATKAGFQPRVIAYSFDRSDPITLHQANAPPGGMTFVPGGSVQLPRSPEMTLKPYWIDEHEVTNAEFKKFVDAGGYRQRNFWKHRFLINGQPVAFETAMTRFVDTTGRPGPAGWELGVYADGKEQEPVGGISWYEAAAYAEFVGKQLPTVYHWYRAAGLGGVALFSDVVQVSNFGSNGPAPATGQRGLGPFGTYDMAGNVKEWCFTEAEGHARFIAGGAWSDPTYMFSDYDAQQPIERFATFGVRLIKPAETDTLAYEGPEYGSLLRPRRDVAAERRPDAVTFETYKRLYAYDRSPLNVKIERSESTQWWRREAVSFDAAYGGERILAHLFLPVNSNPPYQAVIHLPGAYARVLPSSDDLSNGLQYFDFVVRSGRVVLFPVLKGTYERRFNGPAGPLATRDLMIQWAKDVSRSIDYLETRDDIDKTKFAFLGLSMGASEAPIYLTVDPRFRAAVTMANGLYSTPRLAEVEPANFAPYVRTPFLMINGRQDFMRPYESSQLPLFNLIGVADADKRLAAYDGGHLPLRPVMIKETLDWLDRYLGPVQTR